MNVYINTLNLLARARYLDKLSLLGLTEQEDTYAEQNHCMFVDHMPSWPQVEYGHIFLYFIDRPGVYTQRQMMQWRSLDAYNYFRNGHVREVRVWSVSKSSSILIAKVNPSQSSPDNAHHAWVGAKKDGEVITAHCTCMAG